MKTTRTPSIYHRGRPDGRARALDEVVHTDASLTTRAWVPRSSAHSRLTMILGAVSTTNRRSTTGPRTPSRSVTQARRRRARVDVLTGSLTDQVPRSLGPQCLVELLVSRSIGLCMIAVRFRDPYSRPSIDNLDQRFLY